MREFAVRRSLIPRAFLFFCLSIFSAVGVHSFVLSSAYADSPGSFTYQGRLFDSSGTAPLTDTNVVLTLGIYNEAGTCLLYEMQTGVLDLSVTAGTFAVEVGNGTRTASDPGLSLVQVFKNQVGVQTLGVTASCAGGFYPASGEKRKIRITPTIGGVPYASLPDQLIVASPQAMVAQTLQGIAPTGFVAVTGSVSQSTLDALTAGSSSDASGLHNHDSLYLKSGGSSLQSFGSGGFVTTGKVGIGIPTGPMTYDLSFGGNSSKSLGLERQGTAGVVGSNLTLRAGGVRSGETDKAGGNLVLESGTAAGNGASRIEFKTAAPTGSGIESSPVTKMILDGLGKLSLFTDSSTDALTVNGVPVISPTGAWIGSNVFGSTGATGSSGATGATGAGYTGQTGLSGASGMSGATGGTGDVGAAGALGLTGQTGNSGASGATGSSGLSGVTGETGADGRSGATGAGYTGQTGESGTTGKSGSTGETGSQGKSGATGQTGASPFSLNGNDAYYTAGKLGIGTPSPSGLLDLSGTGSILKMRNSANDDSRIGEVIQYHAGPGRSAEIFRDDAGESFVLGSSNVNIVKSQNLHTNIIRALSGSEDTVSSDIFGAGTKTSLRLRNAVGAAVNTGVALGFAANRTTGGMTNTASISSVITDITDNAYKGALVFSTADNASPGERMRIDHTGNVGIGTTAPSGKLDIDGGISFRGTAFANHPQAPAGQGRIYFDSTANKFKVSENNGTYSDLVQAGSTLWAPTGGTSAHYTAAGNVGIGTGAPGSKLQVAGGNIQIDYATAGSADRWVGGSVYNNMVFDANLGQVINSSAEMRFNIDSDNDDVDNRRFTWAKNGNTTGSTALMTLLENGSVGIGTAAPTGRLHVKDGNIVIETSGGFTNGGLQFNHTAAGPYASIYRDTASGDLMIKNDQGNDIILSNGNVGIGTTSPSSALHVKGSGGSNLYLESTSNTQSSMYLQHAGGYGYLGMYGSDMKFYANSNSVPTLTVAGGAPGNVGIGTTAPSGRLDIDGGISFRGVVAGSHPQAPVGQGRIYFDSSDSKFKVSQNNGAYVDLVQAGSTLWAPTGGTSAYFTSAGNVGIGTTSPNTDLEIAKTTAAPILRLNHNNETTDNANIGSLEFFSSDSASNAVAASIAAKTPIGNFGSRFDLVFSTYDIGTLSEKMRITSTGNVGIGTAIPSFNGGSGLHIDYASKATLRLSQTSGGTTGAEIFVDPSGLNFQNMNGSRNFHFITGNVGVGTTGPGSKLEIRADSNTSGAGGDNSQLYITGSTTPSKRLSIAFNSSSNYGELQARTSAGVYAPINLNPNGGNVGIGSVAPSGKLDLSGDFVQRGIASPGVSQTGSGRIYFDSTANKFKVSENNGTYSDLVQAGSTLWAPSGTSAYYNAGGNVGIGTTNPAMKLEVVGDLRLQHFDFTTSIGGGPSRQLVIAPASGTSVNDSVTFALSPAGGAYGAFDISASGSTLVHFGLAALSAPSFINTPGNLGIGTVAPSGKLEVRGTDNTGIIGFGSTAWRGGFLGYKAGNDRIWLGNVGAATGAADTRIRFADDGLGGGVDTVVFRGDGNVGIGTAAPTGKLSVAGNIHITSGSGGGFVFADGTTQATASRSGDISNPGGIKGTAKVISISSGSTYTVPAGKNLYITYFKGPGGVFTMSIDGVAVYANSTNNGFFSPPLIVGPGSVISTDSVSAFVYNGFETEPTVTAKVISVSSGSTYTVPAGKNLYITYFKGPGGVFTMSIDGVALYANSTNAGSFPTPIIVGAGSVISTDSVSAFIYNGYEADVSGVP